MDKVFIMAIIEFEDIHFKKSDSLVKALFMKQFYFEISEKDLNNIGSYKIENSKIIFDSNQEIAERKFERILLKGMNELKNVKNDKPAIYIHKFSGIPLVGSNAFGIVDRDTNIIEIKPITTCNLKCIYCSVNEDRRAYDFILEKDYIVSEFKRVANLKKSNDLEAHIGGQGEPMLYKDIVFLVKDISSIEKVKTISIDTNISLITKEKIDSLVDAGLTRFNFSLNSMESTICSEIAGSYYDIDNAINIIRYASTIADIIIAPVLIPGKNESEMKKIIEFAKTLSKKPIIGIQNYLYYKGGRNPVKPWDMDKFMKFLTVLQEETGFKLILSEQDFSLKKDKSLISPFKKYDVVPAEIICPGRLSNEKIATSGGFIITINNTQKEKGFVKIRITKTKHNIYYGDVVK